MQGMYSLDFVVLRAGEGMVVARVDGVALPKH